MRVDYLKAVAGSINHRLQTGGLSAEKQKNFENALTAIQPYLKEDDAIDVADSMPKSDFNLITDIAWSIAVDNALSGASQNLSQRFTWN